MMRLIAFAASAPTKASQSTSTMIVKVYPSDTAMPATKYRISRNWSPRMTWSTSRTISMDALVINVGEFTGQLCRLPQPSLDFDDFLIGRPCGSIEQGCQGRPSLGDEQNLESE